MPKSLNLPLDFQAHNFMKLYRKEPRGYVKVRLLAMHHLQRGLGTTQVSSIVAYPRQTIWEWVQWYKDGGLIRLQSSPQNRGRKSKLTQEQEASLSEEICKLQDARSGGRINGVNITNHIESHWGVRYAPGSIYTLLRRLNIVWITGRSKHPKANPEEQEIFKK
jgi:transposase|tara:strand:- start:592 stop:1083 length:492 start_codon:yes stop_codon:yes gene_type:complete